MNQVWVVVSQPGVGDVLVALAGAVLGLAFVLGRRAGVAIAQRLLRGCHS